MTLFEFAVIDNLIKTNYRQRMNIFWVNLFFIFMPGFLLISQKPDDIFFILLSVTGLVFSVYFLFKYFISTDDGETALPWEIYKKQSKTLYAAKRNDTPFEELSSYPILSEYF